MKRIVLGIIVQALAGVGVGAVIGVVFTGDWIYTIVASVALALVLVVGFAGGASVGKRARGAGFALARIETIRRAGLETNGVQDCELRLTVADPARGPYQTTIRSVISTENLRRYVPGAIIVVSRISGSQPAVKIVETPPAEWVAQAEQANQDPSIIPPASSVPAWETGATTEKPGRNGSLRKWAVFLLVFGGSAAITLLPAYAMIGRTATNVVTGNFDGNSMITGDYQQEAVDQIAEVAGSYQFTAVSFYESYVIATGLTRPGADTTDEYVWRYGRATREGPELIQSTDLPAELFDASDLDFSAVARAVEDALEQWGDDTPNSIYPSVRRDTFTEGREPVINISIDDDYVDAYFTYDFDGELLSRGGTAFD